MERVTSAEIKQIVIDLNIERFYINLCRYCQNSNYYQFDNDVVSFHSGCEEDRTITFCNTPSRSTSSYEAVAVTFNRLTPKERLSLWQIFLASGEKPPVVAHPNNNEIIVSAT